MAHIQSFSKYSFLLSHMLQLHDEVVPSSPGITRSNLEKSKQSVSIGTVSCTTIYPCSVGASIADALILVSAFDRCSIVAVTTAAHFRGHAVGVAYLVVFAETVVSSIEVHLVARQHKSLEGGVAMLLQLTFLIPS